MNSLPAIPAFRKAPKRPRTSRTGCIQLAVPVQGGWYVEYMGSARPSWKARLDFGILFWDPLEPHPHDVDVKALLRIAVVYNIPIACNRSTADFLLSSPFMGPPDLFPHSAVSSTGWWRIVRLRHGWLVSAPKCATVDQACANKEHADPCNLERTPEFTGDFTLQTPASRMLSSVTCRRIVFCAGRTSPILHWWRVSSASSTTCV